MTFLIVGLGIFLGVHGLTMMRAPRAALIGKVGPGPYKGLYTLAAFAGLALIIYGFGAARAAGYVQIWNPPRFLGHVTALLVTIAFISLAAAYAPNGKIKSTLKHPMLVGVKAWALGHLLANGDLASILLFGGFLAWAVASRISLKSRPDKVEPASAPWGIGDAIAIGGGLVATVVMAIWLHPLLIGVPAILR
ncbi:NnrU family protein [Phreatobacter aquaticus]|uniref:NnrU family protein n=1 Tax=Phreatobacter aquaticus TaxID=2570229 RepID=A0A4D7QSB8_9HYPH|nr:NnrU family protein [Phreatobacter aquaticus]QCK86982.1 NnrU family protein [Phreatobacter aquaticus]